MTRYETPFLYKTRVHRVSLGKKDKEELARILNLALSPMKPLKELPTHEMLKAAENFVKECQEKLKRKRESRTVAAAAKRKQSIRPSASGGSFSDFMPKKKKSEQERRTTQKDAASVSSKRTGPLNRRASSQIVTKKESVERKLMIHSTEDQF